MIVARFTQRQAETVVRALENDLNGDYPDSDPHNRHIQRIIDNLKKLGA